MSPTPRRYRAFSLVEMILALALFTVLGVVVWQLLSFGLRAHRKGENTRLAQHTAREVLDTLSSRATRRRSSAVTRTAYLLVRPVAGPLGSFDRSQLRQR